jgi:hypothetical protein
MISLHGAFLTFQYVSRSIEESIRGVGRRKRGYFDDSISMFFE